MLRLPYQMPDPPAVKKTKPGAVQKETAAALTAGKLAAEAARKKCKAVEGRKQKVASVWKKKAWLLLKGWLKHWPGRQPQLVTLQRWMWREPS
jgi:hypothetical protein